jgi:hypothetical protein
VADATSGPAATTVYGAATTSAPGSFSASVTGADQAGNTTTISCPYNVSAATTTTVSSAANPAMVGQQVTFTAGVSVVAPGTGTPAGTVDFYDGSTKLGSGTLSNGQATYQTSNLALGSHAISATYEGSTSFQGSTTAAALTQNVDTNLTSYPTLANGAYNLSNLNLSGGYFVNLNLAGANIKSANMSGATFSGANLTGANLTSANFSNTNLSGANLTNANLTQTNLKGATGMSTATLTGVISSKTTCPDNTTSTQDGGTCLGHL